MADPFIIHQLQRLPLFARLSDLQLDQVAGVTQISQYAAGQYVFAQGQPTVGAQIFVSGRGALLSSAAQGQQLTTIGTVEAGQIINEGALFDEGIESASLRILEPSLVLLVPRVPVRALMAQDPALQANLRVLDAAGSRDATKILFRGQRANETVYRQYHRHWWGFIRHGWVPFALAAVFLVISVLIDARFPGIGAALACLTVTLPFLATLFLLWEWRNDRFILTDQRLVFISMQAWRITRRVGGVPIDRIGEVQVDVPPGDAFARLFDYGTLVVKTTADRGVLSIRYMPDPFSVQKAVFEHRERFRDIVSSDDESMVRAQVAQVLGLSAPAGAAQAQSGSDEDKEAIYSSQTAGPAWLRTRMISPSGVIYYRHHWIKWLRMQILPVLILLLALFIAGFNLSSLAVLPGGVGLSIGFFIFLMGGVWVYLRDWDWRNDMMIVDNNTVTFQYKRPLWLQNQVEKMSMGQLDNVASKVGGIVGNLLNVGDISLSLVGGNSEKRFRMIGDPESVQAELTWRTQRIKERSRENADNDQREAITQYLQTYHEMLMAQQGGQAAAGFAAQQPTMPNAPAQPTQPMAYATPTIPNAPYPTQAAVAYPTQPGNAPANLTFQAPGVRPPAPPAAAPPAASAPPPQASPPPTGGSRPPRVPRPRPSDLPD
ncbi:MAG TPA: cyclic nucleotide-binding domain-containing protein [Candidatus Limnocylindrales bacterium]|nr:cyclic nucleotide-binding domain-containing protein [Candidatus Limnocylindrales bacterium]